MKLILLGPPGAGKGTQAEILSRDLHIPTISTGNILRAAVKAGTPIGLKAKSYMDAGKLVTDEVIIGIIQERLAESSDEAIVQRRDGRRVCGHCGTPFHLSSNPPKQAGVCDLCGGELIERDDDKPETVRARLEVYHQETEPLKEFYSKRGTLSAVP